MVSTQQSDADTAVLMSKPKKNRVHIAAAKQAELILRYVEEMDKQKIIE